MECTKEIVLNLENNEEWKNQKKKFYQKGVFDKIKNYKILFSVLIVTFSFMVMDMILISSFVNILETI